MASPYIPRRDGLKRQWMESFSNTLLANPSAYMLVPAQAEFIARAVREFDAGYKTASNPGTRTKATIIEKDDARSIAEHLCRAYAALIRVNTGIDDGDKIAIGVRPINPSRREVKCPQTSPLLNILGATPGKHTLRYSDTTTPDSKAKPFGAAHLRLFVALGDKPASGPSEARLYRTYTRSPFTVEFAEADDGKVATYFAQWASSRGDVGPWSLPVSLRVLAPGKMTS